MDAQSEETAKNQAFTIKVSRDTLLLGNHFTLSFELNNIDGEIDLPNLDAFDIIGGPNQSRSMSVINGDMTQKSSYSYILKPIETGSFAIQEAYLETEDGILETAPLMIEVLDNPDGIIQKESKFEDRWMDFDIFPSPPKPPEVPQKKKLKTRRF